MAQPTPYNRLVGFQAEETTLVAGRSTVRTAAIDAELDAIALTIAQIRANLALIQRDDVRLADSTVEIHTLASDVLTLLASGSFVVRGAWVTATAYVLGDIVQSGGYGYLCTTAHTSGAGFAADLAALKWVTTSSIDVNAARSGANTDITSLADVTHGKITMNNSSLIQCEGASVASAATTDIWAVPGDTVHITGSVAIGSFGTAPQAGAMKRVVFDGACNLLDLGNFKLNTDGVNVVTDPGDIALVYADTTTQMDVFLMRVNGQTATRPRLASHYGSIGGDIALNNTALFFKGPAVNIPASGAQICLLAGQVTLKDTAGAATFTVLLTDSLNLGTPIASTRVTCPVGGRVCVSLSGRSQGIGSGSWAIWVKDETSTSGVICRADSGYTNDSLLSGINIGVYIG